MNKQQFLSNHDVKNFIDWLARELNNKGLSHYYEMPKGMSITFNGLEDALAQYDWPFRYLEPPAHDTVRKGNTYADSETALTNLRDGLFKEIANLNDVGALDWTKAIMVWGGVRNGNVPWLENNVSGLARELSSVSNLLTNGDDEKQSLASIQRFNAGMTKVYSLLVPNFIIYDSRVAAALTWLIVRWCQSTKQPLVPEMLRFPCMRPKEGDNPAIRKLRNPSYGNFSFPWMNDNSVKHALWNMRASWILEHALKITNGTKFHNQSNPLRSLEAALFMWGYDLSKNLTSEVREESTQEQGVYVEHSADSTHQESEWHSLKTLGGGNAVGFEWRFDLQKDLIIIKRTNGTVEHFKTEEIFQIIQVLYDFFGNDYFPLANSVTKMPTNTEKLGLGSAIYNLSTIMNKSKRIAHAQAASQLGVVLGKMGIFKLSSQSKIMWHLCIELPTNIEILRMILRNPEFDKHDV